ncbi:Segregation and condensation protein B [hydrothermal vent metagenome]|uniref:Segregation and condensation protein B n=1 Tax=hydrothermal vent metagenome TaxID=652676 RepID=A0A3B0ULK6_9ZZZZ
MKTGATQHMEQQTPDSAEIDAAGDVQVATSEAEQLEINRRNIRVIEALLFASSEPISIKEISPFLSHMANTELLLAQLAKNYADRGVNLVQRGDKWAFRTADDLGFLLRREERETRSMSRAALETMSIIAYHQPVTRAEIEEIRGVAAGRGTLDMLMEAQWVRMRGRRRTPGRPVTYGTTPEFLDHFSLSSLGDLPGLEELKGSGMLSSRLPPEMQIPLPFEGELSDDEDPLEEDDPVFARDE